MRVFSCFSFSVMIWRLNGIEEDCGKAEEHNAVIPYAQVPSTGLD